MLNRYGASLPQGEVFALVSDLVPISGTTLSPGNVRLRPDKRPRPLVLRVPQKFSLQVTLFNYLGPSNSALGTYQPANNEASFHVNGLNLVNTIHDDGTLAGANTPTSGILCNTLNAGCTTTSMTYTLYAAEAGNLLRPHHGHEKQRLQQLRRPAHRRSLRLGQRRVPGAEFYRSQVSQADFSYAASGPGRPVAEGQLHRALSGELHAARRSSAPKACWPVLAMVAQPAVPYGNQCQTQTGPLVTYYSDLTAIITGPNQGNFTGDGPEFDPVSALPNRRFPFREFTIEYHELIGRGAGVSRSSTTAQTPGLTSDAAAVAAMPSPSTTAPAASAPRSWPTVSARPDGTAAADCGFEEFFLSSWTVGDPAMVVDVPGQLARATAVQRPVEQRPGTPVRTARRAPSAAKATRRSTSTPVRKATKALYPDDPSNVYHSYIGDHVKFRILHAGTGVTHVHHQHAHQWLHIAEQRRAALSRQPDDQSRRALHAGDGLQRQRQPEPDASATRSSTATSIRTSPRACGRCGACTTCSRAGTKLERDRCRPQPKYARAAGRRDRARHADPGGRADADLRHGADAGAGEDRPVVCATATTCPPEDRRGDGAQRSGWRRDRQSRISVLHSRRGRPSPPHPPMDFAVEPNDPQGSTGRRIANDTSSSRVRQRIGRSTSGHTTLDCVEATNLLGMESRTSCPGTTDPASRRKRQAIRLRQRLHERHGTPRGRNRSRKGRDSLTGMRSHSS